MPLAMQASSGMGVSLEDPEAFQWMPALNGIGAKEEQELFRLLNEHAVRTGGDGYGSSEFLRHTVISARVMVLASSEFGRRVAENGSGGTDHGTAAPMFVFGNGLKGGLYGAQPSLADLVDGDLKHVIDFRSVYATVLDRWLGADPVEILGSSFDRVGFI